MKTKEAKTTPAAKSKEATAKPAAKKDATAAAKKDATAAAKKDTTAKPAAKKDATVKPATKSKEATAKPATKSKEATAKPATDPIMELFVRIGTGKKGPEARMELRKLPAADVAPRAIAAFSDPRPKVRGNAYEIAARPDLRPLIPLTLLLAGLTDPDPGVRLSTVIALNRGEGIKNTPAFMPHASVVIPALAALADDPDKRVKAQAKIVHDRYVAG